ncbi:MAG: hypothetical protein LBS11_04290 [Oscillospiraceae bacterium]|nr:hypothetical protein [Oscillospiraceae bacterium]
MYTQYWKLEDRGNNLCYQEFEKQLADRGIEIEYELVSDASIADTVRMRMAAQVDVPDMIADAWIGITESEVLAWAGNGLILDVKKLVDQYDEDGSIFKYYDDHTPGVLASLTAADGGLYWFSYLNAPTMMNEDGSTPEYYGNSYMPSIRADWMESVGIPYSMYMTHDELFDTLKAFQDNDANGNGAADEVMAIDIKGYSNGIARSFGLSLQTLAAIDKATNKVYNNLDKPEFKSYINYMKRLYEAGLYDTTALADGMTTQLIADNKAALTFHYAIWDTFEPTISGATDPAYAPIILDDDAGANGFYSTVDPKFGQYCRYIVTSACRDPQAVVDLYDYIYTDEYAYLDMLGIEGKSYEKNEFGVPVSLVDPDWPADFAWEYASVRNTVGMIAVPSVLTTPSVRDRTKELKTDYRKLKSEYIKYFLDEGGAIADLETYGNLSLLISLPSPEEQARLDEIDNVLDTYMSELLTDLILGNRSLDDLDQYVEELNVQGLADYMAIIQARRDRFIEAVGAN